MSERLSQINAWLDTRLGGSAVRLERASDDASFRRYLRVVTGERRYILMDAPPDKEDCAAFIAVARLLDEAGVNVPAIVAQDTEAGFLLLSDLGEQRYLDVLNARNADRLYADALGALAAMQARVDCDSLPEYDRGELRREMGLFPQWFLAAHLGVQAPGAWFDAFEHAAQFLADVCLEQPQVFVHRDYHSRNLMLDTTHNPGVLDFQDAVRGPLCYDLVSLFRDVYIEWPRPRVESWAAGYHRRAVRQGIVEREDPEGFLRWFDLTGVQRHLKVAGIFCRLYHRDGKAGYLADIPLTLRYLFDVGGRYPELERFCALCGELRLEQRLLEANAGAGVR